MFLPELIAAVTRHTLLQLTSFILRNAPNKPLARGPVLTPGISYPAQFRPGNPQRGLDWLKGDYTLPGGVVLAPGEDPFNLRPPSPIWVESIHGFDWLRHLLAAPDPEASALAGRHIINWVLHTPLSNGLAWLPHTAARRFMNFSRALPYIMPVLTPVERSRLLYSMGIHARFLKITARFAPDGLPRLTAMSGLAYSAFALSDGASRLHDSMMLLKREIKRQILDDGGHIGRAPESLTLILSDLLAIRDALVARAMPVPVEITRSISLMGPLLSFFSYDDGRLAVFNGGTEGQSEDLAALREHEILPDTTPFHYATASGYQRLSGGDSLLMIDTGQVPPSGFSSKSHIGPLSMEFSYAGQRMIVNCGPNVVSGADWLQASRTPPAHSTLSLVNSSDKFFVEHPKALPFLGPRILTPKVNVSARRFEDAGGTWLETAHGFYTSIIGYSHHRRIYLTADGLDLRGEDMLLPEGKTRTDAEFVVRFHLHPQVNVSPSADGKSALLRIRKQPGWRFLAGGKNLHEMKIIDSVYMGKRGIPARSQQIVLSSRARDGGAFINWGLKLIS